MIKCSPINTHDLRLLIAQEGKSIRNFAENIGISHSYLSQILNMQQDPSPVVAKKIADGLNLNLSEIFLISMVDEQPNEEVS